MSDEKKREDQDKARLAGQIAKGLREEEEAQKAQAILEEEKRAEQDPPIEDDIPEESKEVTTPVKFTEAFRGNMEGRATLSGSRRSIGSGSDKKEPETLSATKAYKRKSTVKGSAGKKPPSKDFVNANIDAIRRASTINASPQEKMEYYNSGEKAFEGRSSIKTPGKKGRDSMKEGGEPESDYDFEGGFDNFVNLEELKQVNNVYGDILSEYAQLEARMLASALNLEMLVK